MNLSKRFLLNLVSSGIVTSFALSSHFAAAQSADVAAALAHPDRPTADAAADATRHPVQVLVFAGLKTGMDVFEMEAAGGYYTEILSRSVGEDGSVVLQEAPDLMGFVGDGIELRTANNRLPNVRVSMTNFDDLDAEDSSIDMVTWTQGPHELGFAPEGNNLGDPAGAFAEIVRILKPGGVLLAIDHIAANGAGLAAGGTIHRIEESVITQLATEAGLSVYRRSELLMNADDPLTAHVYDPSIRGKTSRFIVVYKK